MKKLLIASLLLCAAGSASAGWVRVHDIPNVLVAYTDPAAMRRNGDIVSIVMMYNMVSPQTTKTGVQFLSNRVELDFNCKNNTKRGKSVAFFASKMAEGQPAQSAVPPDEWTPVEEGNPSLPELKYACGKK